MMMTQFYCNNKQWGNTWTITCLEKVYVPVNKRCSPEPPQTWSTQTSPGPGSGSRTRPKEAHATIWATNQSSSFIGQEDFFFDFEDHLITNSWWKSASDPHWNNERTPKRKKNFKFLLLCWRRVSAAVRSGGCDGCFKRVSAAFKDRWGKKRRGDETQHRQRRKKGARSKEGTNH